MQLVHIRKNVLKISQRELADIAGTTQASVSRWEAGEQEPSLSEMAKIREAARAQGIQWDDRWFFDALPSASATAASSPEAA